MIETLKELGYYMPAEWEKHSAVWLAWPYGDITFPNILEEIEKTYCEIIKTILKSEEVKLIVLNDIEKKRIENIFNDYGIQTNKITFFIQDYADVWTRDYAPITIINKQNIKTYLKWNYNAYGREDDLLFSDLLKDDKVFLSILNKHNIEFYQMSMVLEGGAIESNGRGTLLTTEQTLLNHNRNGNLTKLEIENNLKNNLGVENIIWLKNGLTNDHTDGHIDEIARFVNFNTIVCAYENDINDPNYHILDENYKILCNSYDQDGNKFNIIKLPMPHMNYSDGEKAPVSYTNFYIGNSIILMPFFNDENDINAKNILQSIFLDRLVVPVDCSRIIIGGGALHCITMQEYI